MFLSINFLSAFNLLTRAFTCVLLQSKGGVTLVAKVLGGELAFYFVVKVLRRDLRFGYQFTGWAQKSRVSLRDSSLI